MTRHVLRLFLAGVSLVLCVATALLWVRSYFAHDALDWGMRRGRAGLLSADGRLGVGHTSVPASAMWRVPRGLQHRIESRATELKPSFSDRLGMVQVTYVVTPAGFQTADVRIPYWFLLPVTSIPFALWLYGRLWPPVSPRCCPACGYDLRATPDRCPECGRQARLHPSG